MALKLEFEAVKRGDLKSIDEKNAAFKGTVFADHKFRMAYKKLKRTEVGRLRRKHTRRIGGIRGVGSAEEIDGDAVEVDRFVETIVEWEGITDESGNEVPCDDDHKRAIAESFQEFASLIMLAIAHNEVGLLNELVELEEEMLEGEEPASKNLPTSGGGDSQQVRSTAKKVVNLPSDEGKKTLPVENATTDAQNSGSKTKSQMTSSPEHPSSERKATELTSQPSEP